MTRQLALMAGIGALAGVAGAATLARPAAIARLAHLTKGEPALYALRIAGMMLFALGAFLGGFAAMFALAGAA